MQILDFFGENVNAFVALGVLISALTSVFVAVWASQNTLKMRRADALERRAELILNDATLLLNNLGHLNAVQMVATETKQDTETESYLKALHEVGSPLHRLRLRLNPNVRLEKDALDAVEAVLAAKPDELGEKSHECVAAFRNLVISFGTEVTKEQT
ncbi:MAG: hypothetical protein JJ926_10280 [Roseitalea sp.]|nr:hypothetical protein [Roseitalea sp.]MBO6952257.1 hypothetical protein [Rhizobiaceae bacterium]MBO6591897.1 hypothetical protein [Roseitalea sp.]MBO6598152.1 hypothetical protein [Roseitalea sp.]MBO6610598.1 hypothetical protein [Roseitalea sp.]